MTKLILSAFTSLSMIALFIALLVHAPTTLPAPAPASSFAEWHTAEIYPSGETVAVPPTVPNEGARAAFEDTKAVHP